MPLRLFILQPTIVFQAQINLANPVYPLSALPYDNVSIGAHTAVKAGMTLVIGPTAGDDEKGRQRVRKIPTADTIFVGRSSQGTRDGELDVIDNHWITVYDDYRVWARPPYIDPAQVFMPDAGTPLWTTYKDGDIEVGTNTTLPPPVANCGPGWAGTKPALSDALVEFNAVNSFATADGASITGYFWDIGDGTFFTGTETDAFIVATFPPGFRWVSLIVNDSNDKSHIAYAPVYVRDPANDDSIAHVQITERTLRRDGQTISFKILQNLPRSNYPDGTLFMLWEDSLSVPSGRSHMEFIGWHHNDPTQINVTKLGVTRDTTLTCLDVAGKLGTLPGLPQILNTDAVREDLYGLDEITWEFMPDPTWNKWLHYLLHWHSTALNLADWTWIPDGDTYPFIVREAQAATLFEMVDAQCQNLVPDHYLACNSVGQMAVLPDPILVPLADRTSIVQTTLGPDKWRDISYTYSRFKPLYWLWSSAIGTQEVPEYLDSTSPGAKPRLKFPTYFCVAPGHAPGQGAQQQTIGNKLARTQAEFNINEGNRYGKINARHDRLRITLATGSDHSIEPASMTWVNLEVPAAYAPQRGLRFTEARGLVHEVSYRYTYSAAGPTVDIELEWEREVFPNAAVTVTPGVATPPPIFTDPEEPPEIPDDPIFYNPIKGYILWDGAHVMRTWDLLGDPPTWELVDAGITGDIYDGQYVMVDATTVGMWLMTSTAIWWCGDIMATTPSWTNVLPIATVQAADAAPASGYVNFQTMAHYASEPGYLCVATGLRDTAAADARVYPHGYFWHTHNYGATWTQVDTDYLNITTLSNTRGFCRANLYSMSIYTTSPGTIYCLRSAPQVGASAPQRILVSRDLGDTWEFTNFIKTTSNNQFGGTVGPAPYPDVTDAFYATQGSIGTSLRPFLWYSDDEWANSTQLTANGDPTGYGGFDQIFRVNKRTHDPNHVMGWLRHTESQTMHLLESYDRGATWALLLDSGVQEGNLGGIPQQTNISTSRYNTPNGWPPDPDLWILVRCMPLTGTTNVTANAIQLTTDNFATLQDKTGNIAALVGTDNWTPGPCNGFALPKVGVNA